MATGRRPADEAAPSRVARQPSARIHWWAALSESALIAGLALLASLLHAAWGGRDLLPAAAASFVAILAYLAVRRWLRRRFAAENGLTVGQLLAQLQWAVKRIEAEPARAPQLLATMLRESIQLAVASASPAFVPIAGHRRLRVVPPDVTSEAEAAIGRIERSIALDAATERGRLEERLRLAHDLHDDIGSRLLTLIYKARTPDVENYLRQTLDDLKTLTRGLAAEHHRLADASAEWRLNLVLRLAAAELALDWSCRLDADPALTVVQWSALTRILRELVSNAIAHAAARTVQVHLLLADDRLELLVADDGHGVAPTLWSHGLGLSSVRKRVKQLGGEIAWQACAPHGIACRVTVERLSTVA